MSGSIPGLIGGAAGAGLTGYGMSMNPKVGNVQMPNLQGDLSAIDKQMGTQQGMTDKYMNDLGSLWKGSGSALMQNMADQLSPGGAAGDQLMKAYNNNGLLNSGAFNQGLAQSFQPMMQSLLTGQLGAQSGALDQGYKAQSGLGMGSLQRQFGVEDLGTQASLATQIAQMQADAQKQQALISGGTNMMGKAMGGK